MLDVGSYSQQVWEKISEMEVKTPFFREESDSYTIGLNIIPIYFFSFFRVPKRVVDKLVSDSVFVIKTKNK